MAITALYSAATGLRGLSTRIDVVANNLANAETTAFKGSRANFEDLYYQELKQPGTTDSVRPRCHAATADMMNSARANSRSVPSRASRDSA